jgi:hypothetical protein
MVADSDGRIIFDNSDGKFSAGSATVGDGHTAYNDALIKDIKGYKERTSSRTPTEQPINSISGFSRADKTGMVTSNRQTAPPSAQTVAAGKPESVGSAITTETT